MSQVFHKCMIAVDWCSLTLLSREPLSHEHVSVEILHNADQVQVAKHIYIPANESMWVWEPRKYGTKQFKTIWDIGFVDEDGVVEPFGVLCAEPTTKSMDPCMCSLKLDNHLLYRDGQTMWVDALRLFLADYQLRILTFSRVDLACDFLFLRNRISGPQLVDKLKTIQWWKCGSVNVSEHYKMPYSIKSDSWGVEQGDAPQFFKQQGQLAPRVETMTFGTMSSDAQVCIYDKTLELNRTAVKIERNGEVFEESAKEYIRDCHKAAGVYNPRRHTWRVEIRLKSKALFLYDEQRHQERPIELTDLDPLHLCNTYIAAASKYFKIVDPTCGGNIEITPQYCESIRSHKNRLPVVDLFPPATLIMQFTKKRYHEAANQFNRAVIKRLDDLGDRLQRTPCKYTSKGDADLIPELIDRLAPVAKQMKEAREKIQTAVAALRQVHDLLLSAKFEVSQEDIDLIFDARDMLERHVNTESPQFTRNVISMLQKFANRVAIPEEDATSRPIRSVPAVHPSDSQVLLQAAEVLKGIYVDVVYDERRASETCIYEKALHDSMQLLSMVDDPPVSVLTTAYNIIESTQYLPERNVRRILMQYRDTQAFDIIRVDWDMELWHHKLHHRGEFDPFIPPLIPLALYRRLTHKLRSL